MQPLPLILLLGALSLLPLAVVMLTSFTKIAVVTLLVRNALGVQQIPPNIALYALSLVLSLYVMAPVVQHAWAVFTTHPEALGTTTGLLDAIARAAEPLRGFLARNTHAEHAEFFMQTAHRLWPEPMAAELGPTHFLVLIPAFAISELTAAFQIGFLLYLPFVVIDLVVQSILLALGMMMMSPMTVSLPLKLLLFVLVSGWTKLVSVLVLSYA